MEQIDHVQQLVQSVQALTASLAEERQERLASQKRQRTFLAGILVAVLVTGWLAWPVAPAQANVAGLVAPLEKLEMDVKEINQFFKNVNLLVDNLNGLVGPDNRVLQDVGTLIARFKQDSDVLRRSMLPPALQSQTKLDSPLLDQENASPTLMLSGAGAMVKGELSLLNQIMLELAYYMRNTLGRASSWMSYMPTP